MSILIDHCVPRKFSRLLQTWGYSTCFLTEHIAADATDSDVIALAQKLDAVLLTVDLDFANILVYPPGSYAGIIVMRYNAAEESALIHSLEQALADLYRDSLRNILIIIEPTRYRIRRGSA
jgi:predicted nuclease of predicted toxin-antitoxin system